MRLVLPLGYCILLCVALNAQTAKERYQAVSEAFPELEGDYSSKSYETVIKSVEGLLHDSSVDTSLILGLKELGCNAYHKSSVQKLLSGELNKAVDAAKKSRKYISTHLGKSNDYYTRSLNTLGTCYSYSGQYFRAKKTFEEGRVNKEKRAIKDMQYARILNGLAKVLINLNDYEPAEACIQASLNIKEKEKGKGKDYAKTLYTLTIIQEETGRYEQALRSINEAITIVDEKGSDNTDYLQLKASILTDLSRLSEALDVYKKVNTQREALGESEYSDLGKSHMAISGIHLSSLQDMPREQAAQQALENIEKSIDLFNKSNGPKHIYHALALRQKAEILMATGDAKNVKPLLDNSLKVVEDTYKKDHIEIFRSKFALFKYFKNIGKYSESDRLLEELDNLILQHIVSSSQFLSNIELNKITRLYKKYLQELYELTSLNPSNVSVSSSINNSIFFKGFVLENMISQRRAINASEKITQMSQQIAALEKEINGLLVLDDPNMESISNKEGQKKEAQSKLSRALGEIRSDYQRVTWEDIQNTLDDDELAIDLMRIKNEDEHIYGALIISPYDDPVFVKLFAEQDLVSKFSDSVSNTLDIMDRLYAMESRGGNVELEPVSLHDMIWQPLSSYLDEAELIYYSCDGILHGLSLEAIPLDDESTLSDRYDFLRMTSLKNLVKKDYKFKEPSDQSILVGGVEYGPVNAETRGRNKRGSWKNLSHTKTEVDKISELMSSKGLVIEKYSGTEATESKIKKSLASTKSPKVLHFATHGFFDTDDIFKVASDNANNGTENALLNSGIVLANANKDGRQGQDNMLTSSEITAFELDDTELVVLSACESGLGNVSENEGVYGLQRAFKIAGTEYLIMTLWEVDDTKTKDFMVSFYQNYLNKELSVIEAFNATQDEMKSRFYDPESWAGIILLN